MKNFEEFYNGVKKLIEELEKLNPENSTMEYDLLQDLKDIVECYDASTKEIKDA